MGNSAGADSILCSAQAMYDAMYDAAVHVAEGQGGGNGDSGESVSASAGHGPSQPRDSRSDSPSCMQQSLCNADAMRVKVTDSTTIKKNSNVSLQVSGDDGNRNDNELPVPVPVSVPYPIFESIGSNRLRLRKFTSAADTRVAPISRSTMAKMGAAVEGSAVSGGSSARGRGSGSGSGSGSDSDIGGHNRKLRPSVAEASQFIEAYCHDSGSFGYLRHKLQQGDMLVMDNFGLTHGRLPYTMKPGQKRVLHRISFRNNGGWESKVRLGVQQTRAPASDYTRK